MKQLIHDLLQPTWSYSSGRSTWRFDFNYGFQVSYLKGNRLLLFFWPSLDKPVLPFVRNGLTYFTNNFLQNFFIDDPFIRNTALAVQTENVSSYMVEVEPGKPQSLVSLEYKSPLMGFKSYRLHKNYPLSLNSKTHSNRIDPLTPFCRFDLHGVCNDDECPYQHQRDYVLKEKDLLVDLASYAAVYPEVQLSKAQEVLSPNERINLIQSLRELILETTPQHKDPILKNAQVLLQEIQSKQNSKSQIILSRRRKKMQSLNLNKPKRRKIDKEETDKALHVCVQKGIHSVPIGNNTINGAGFVPSRRWYWATNGWGKIEWWTHQRRVHRIFRQRQYPRRRVAKFIQLRRSNRRKSRKTFQKRFLT